MSRWSIRSRWLILAAVALALLSAVAGCARTESRTLEHMPAPVFTEPPTDWPDRPAGSHPTSGPAGDQRTDDIEAAWRDHILPARQWKWIVIHHSGGPGGDARNFDEFHRRTRPDRFGKEMPGWDELGYHFVIGNGTDTADGLVEIGPRWIKQKHGAHCATPSHQFNDFGIGVCLVGNFELPNSRPSAAQWAAAVELCRFLCREYCISADHIIGHRDGQAAEGSVTTECPGKNFDLPAFRKAVESGDH